jgi:hypothetical protein
VLPAVGVEKDGIFVEIGLSARPTRVFVETVKQIGCFQGICLGKDHQIVSKKKMIRNLRRVLGG